MPFVSKVKGVNLMEYVAEVILGGRLELPGDVYEPPARRWGVKTPQFSWSRLRGAYPVVDVEMRSTGEVAAVGRTLHDALLKSWLAAQPNRLPEPGSLAIVVGDGALLAERLRRLGLEPLLLDGADINGLVEAMRERRVGLVVASGDGDYALRRAAADYLVPLVLNPRLAALLLEALEAYLGGEELTVEPL
jgi:carbamoyl-phosphate synthase large subunit